MGLADLPTMAEVAALRAGKPLLKGLPRMLAKEERDAEKQDRGKAFRDAVWARDKGRSRATGKQLLRSGTLSWDELGEVDHVIDRSLDPSRIYDVGNGILLSKRENRLKKTACPRAPEFRMFSVDGPDDRGKPQNFCWRDKDGKVLKRSVG